jgi:tRNA-splicing ligase RtcB (3'-phosphate/5'-hydroxy nucleic acid ligase)
MHHDLVRLDDYRLKINNQHQHDVVLYANDQVLIESAAVRELQRVLELAEHARAWAEAEPSAFATPPALARVRLTPDFHKGSGVPVGTTMLTEGFFVPNILGNDIGCGMRLHCTNFTAADVLANTAAIETSLRSLFFEAGRNIPMTGPEREAALMGGVNGLLATIPNDLDDGLWQQVREIEPNSLSNATVPITAGLAPELADPRPARGRDPVIGSIGGGNHFVEIQQVERILDASIAHAWGIKAGQVLVMAHSGSLGLGRMVSALVRERVRRRWPQGLAQAKQGLLPLPCSDRALVWDVLANAANFAQVNRFFLALMAVTALEKVLAGMNGTIKHQAFYDSPHNWLWPTPTGMIQRKGATPARGAAEMATLLPTSPFAWTGEPVLVPGSMGTSSVVLAGLGNDDALMSACHGAGRALARGAARKTNFELEALRVVTPLDLRASNLRRDIVQQKLKELSEEGPKAYKDIWPAVDTLAAAGIAKPVFELKPLITVKG